MTDVTAVANPEAAWRAGRLSARSGSRKLLFGRVYEDSTIELQAFARGERVFCIASAGCTALALCRDHDVVACDINPAQIEYVRRRLAGGGREVGSAERVMGFMRALMPLAGWSRARMDRFLSSSNPEEQLSQWRRELDNWRFRTGLAVLLSPLWLRSVYASALLSCLPERFDRVLRGRLRRCFERHPNSSNPFARALLSGDRGDVEPHVEGAAARLELVVGDAAAYLEKCPRACFGGLSISNILDGADDAYRKRLFAAVRHAAKPGAPLVSRSFSEPGPGLLTNRAADDRSMLWGIVDVRPVEALEW